MVDAINNARMALQAALDRGDPVAVKRNVLGTLACGATASAPELARMLSQGANPDTSDWDGDTFLHWVIRWHPLSTLPDVVEMLLEAGADGDRVMRPLEELKARLERSGPDSPNSEHLIDRLSAYLPMDGDSDWMSDFD
jgi:hypothetical protein